MNNSKIIRETDSIPGKREYHCKVKSLVKHIIYEINNETPKDKHILRALLYEMLMLLDHQYAKQHTDVGETSPNRHVDKFVTLAEKYFKKHHDVEYYADKLYITPSHLNELAQKGIGTSPKCYILNRIIREAKVLMSYTILSVSEIADQLGFENSSYFIRLFRNKTGLTPTQYRRSINRANR